MGESEYVTLRTRRAWTRGIAALPRAFLRRLDSDPEDFLWQHLDRPVKISHTAVIVVGRVRLSAAETDIAYKQYRSCGLWKRLALWLRLRPSRARRSWNLGRALLARGIATARPLAVCEPRPWTSARRSYLVTEWIVDAENLHLYGWRLLSSPLHERLARAARCAESLGRLVGRMHAAAISNRDLKGANLLVVDPDPPTRGDLPGTYIVDLDGVRLRRRLSRGRRAADLARLAVGLEAHPWVSRTICRRFLRAYLAALTPDGAPSDVLNKDAAKQLWRDVAWRCRRLISRMRQRGEELL
jgi:tRNA A-37 threonylcarbamoyl transferase component Bud32